MPTRTQPPSLDALLASFHAAPDGDARALVGAALVETRLRGERILPALVRAFDSDELVAKANCAICSAEILGELAEAIDVLGGTLTEAQCARLERIRDEADRMWVPVSGGLPPEPSARAPATRTPRPERNAPCPCGSGKKFKRCCALERSGAGGLH
jgi:hypothetical protein